MTMTHPFAVLFDWDGVIVDSSSQHEESWERLADERQFNLPHDHFLRGFGRKNEIIIGEFLQWAKDPAEIHRLSLRKEELYREIVQERGLSALPGVHAFLQILQDAGIPFCIGSSTHRANIDTILEIIGLDSFFKNIITAEDVNAGKPDPTVFLKAAQKTNTPPERCVVIEDAFVGIEAARRGNMKVVAVATTNPIEKLHEADLAIPSLEGLTLQDIQNLFPSSAQA